MSNNIRLDKALQELRTPLGLSARWTHEEKETLVGQADKLNRGDISGWARGNPWFKRPEIAQQPKVKCPVKNLAELRREKPKPAEPKRVELVQVAKCVTKFDPEEVFPERNRKKIAISNRFDQFYESRIIRK